MSIQGLWFDGQTSKGEAIELSISDTGLVYFSNDLTPVSFDELKVSAQIGQTPRYITFTDHSGHIETSALTLLSEWERRFKKPSFLNLAHTLEKKWQLVAVAILFTIFSSWMFVQYGIPAASKSVAKVVPQVLADEMGAEALVIIDNQFFEPTTLSLERQRSITHSFNQTLPQNRTAHYTLHFRASPVIGANALALPSGDIIITDELIKLTENDAEALAVLLHEIGHVELRHSLRTVVQTSLISLFTMVFTGDSTGVSSLVTMLPVVLLHTSYTRGMEEEADAYALQQMLKWNLPPQHFAHIMKKLSLFWSTHTGHFS